MMPPRPNPGMMPAAGRPGGPAVRSRWPRWRSRCPSGWSRALVPAAPVGVPAAAAVSAAAPAAASRWPAAVPVAWRRRSVPRRPGRSSRRRRPWWTRRQTAGAFGRRGGPAGARQEEQEAAQGRVRQHVGTGDRRRSGSARQRRRHPPAARRVAVRLRRQDQRQPGLARAGHVPPRRDGHGDPVGQRGHPAAARCRAELQVQVVSPEDEDRELLESFDLTFGDRRGRGRAPRRPAAGRHRHGSRRPRQDPPARRDPQHQRRQDEAGGITQHIGAYQVHVEHERQRPPDHVHRHPGSRGVHRHACPWCGDDRHRRARGRGRRRRDAADDRGAQPRPGGRRADRGRGEQDRQGGRQPGEGAPAAHRVRAGRRGVRRRHALRRCVGAERTSTSTACSRASCSRPTPRSTCGPTRTRTRRASSSRPGSTAAAVRWPRCSCSAARCTSATRWWPATRTVASARCSTRTATRSTSPARPVRCRCSV